MLYALARPLLGLPLVAAMLSTAQPPLTRAARGFTSTATLPWTPTTRDAPTIGGNPVGEASVAPSANLVAFRGQGHLAFLWRKTLYVLDGVQGALRQITPSGHAGTFAWSPDGRWLAYDTGAGDLWLTQASGTGTHRVRGLPAPVASYAWQPASDALIIGLRGTAAVARHFWMVAPTGQPHEGTGAAALGLPSPDGKTLAYTVTLPFRDPETRSDALYTVPAAGGHPIRRFLGQHAGIGIAAWWPDSKGLLFWLDPYHSDSIAADGLGLYTLPLGGTPHLLTTALPRGISVSSAGRVLLMVGTGRELWHNKSLAICAVETAACRALPHQQGVVALEPAWSPDGNRVAFVQAQDRGGAVGASGFTTTRALLSWVHTHTLWIEDAGGGHARKLAAAGTGIYQPQWSGDGRHLLYIRDNALWLIAANGGAPARIVGPFPGTPDLFGFYGDPSWPITFAWNRH